MLTKGFSSIVIIISVLALFVVAGASFVIYRGSTPVKTQLEESKPGVKEEQIVQKPLQESEIDTSTWKTYRNEKYGFEVRYPPSFSLKEDDNGLSIPLHFELVIQDEEKIYFALEIWEKGGHNGVFSLSDIPLLVEARNKPNSYFRSGFLYEHRTINGINGIEWYDDFCNIMEGCLDDFLFEHRNWIWVIELKPLVEKKMSEKNVEDGLIQVVDEELYHTILNSFRLTF